MEDSQWEDNARDLPAWVDWLALAARAALVLTVLGLILFAWVALP